MERVNVYLPTHKALRAVMFDVIAWVGRTDFGDDAEAGTTIVALRRVLNFLKDHAEHEERWIHSQLKERFADEMRELDEEHEVLHARMQELARMTNRLWSLQGDRRQAVADELHTELNLFLGDFLHHLHREETETNALLWQHFTDAELVKLQGDLLSSISPVRFAEWMQIMLPSMNTRERAFLVGGMKQAVPQPMFEGFTNLAEQVLGEQAWTAVQERLLS